MLNDLKTRVAATARKAYSSSLTWGLGGNVSGRDLDSGHVVITATGVSLKDASPENLAVVNIDGEQVSGDFMPSSETPMHTGLYRELGERVCGLVHTHSPAATAMSCVMQPIPAIHYLMAAVGNQVPVAAYATYGTPEMCERILEVIGDGNAVLLANHGVMAMGADIDAAYGIAQTVEFVADLYLRARAIAEPAVIPPEEIENLAARFQGYGQIAKAEK